MTTPIYPPSAPTDPLAIFNTIEALRVVFLQTANTPPSDVWLGPAQGQAVADYLTGHPWIRVNLTPRSETVIHGCVVRASDRPEIRVGLSIPHDYLALAQTYCKP